MFQNGTCPASKPQTGFAISKALEFAYSPSLRAQLIAQEMRAKGAEIKDALAMLERSAQESPLLARALARI